ncbi:MAG TPA: aldo/keto reductase [Clostridiales bacterium]|nr:MAG: General stress protein 69 [Firmicutes bacterium ADurb.Bin262]HOU10839.1 aldo/keto reductase [Clostridiales bacterium]
MHTRIFREGFMPVSALGFGCMRLPQIEGKKDKIDEQAAREMVDYAIEHGVNYFDTAFVYHSGKSETFLGSALAGYDRESYCLATKMPPWIVGKTADLKSVFELQLEKLNTRYIDFYLLHSLDAGSFAKFQKVKAYEFLEKMRDKGKIKFIGFSFHDNTEVFREILDAHDWDFAQLQLNYVDRAKNDAGTQLDLLAERGIPCIVMEPVRGGALANPGPGVEAVFNAMEPGRTMASWALRYAASLPNVLTVLSGMSSLEQMKENVELFSDFCPLAPEQMSAAEKAGLVFAAGEAVGCTACRYCMDCPSGVDIPGVFALFNDYKKTGDAAAFLAAYAALPDGSKAEDCTACGVCKEKCPQTIDIPKKMEEIARLMPKLV